MNLEHITEENFNLVLKIYKAGIATGKATFETQMPSFEKWDNAHHTFGRITFFNNHSMLGWGALSKVSNRCVYKGVAENSLYVSPSYQGMGVGTKILKKLIEISETNIIWTLQCGIMPENSASIHLHKKCGFREIGYREKIGQLNGVWKDNIIMERRSNKIGI
ncbi:GNAT family N-acetyltransferase [Aureibaculum luteum]|uniref:GNAT family N-acetyltransferase n=1 Tax=Aureibaculum luteum TaxID=1548456 RepID=UPI0018E52773|nr:GNAT family N-acetyltransferase [Aureibaculum luteum]